VLRSAKISWRASSKHPAARPPMVITLHHTHSITFLIETAYFY